MWYICTIPYCTICLLIDTTFTGTPCHQYQHNKDDGFEMLFGSVDAKLLYANHSHQVYQAINTNCHSNLNILVFTASLVDYKNKPLIMDDKSCKNAMYESIQLFGEITTLPCFKRYHIWLVFTDSTQFFAMIRQNDPQLIDAFASYPQWSKINNIDSIDDDIKVDGDIQVDQIVQFVSNLYLQSFMQHRRTEGISATYQAIFINDDNPLSQLTSRIHHIKVLGNVEASAQIEEDKHMRILHHDHMHSSLLLPSNKEIEKTLNNANSIAINIDENKFEEITPNYNQVIESNSINNNYNDYINVETGFFQIDHILINDEEIGEGGSAKVCKGFDTKHKVQTAVKIIVKKNELNYYKWFALQEIDGLRNLFHDNVIKLLGYNLNAPFENGTCVMFVLEYANNGSLTQLIKQLGYIPEILARTYFRQIVQGLKACHDAFVIHRDINCANRLLDENYNIKISDFGLSKVMYKRIISLFSFALIDVCR